MTSFQARRIICDSILRVIRECDLINQGSDCVETIDTGSNERVFGVSFDYRIHADNEKKEKSLLLVMVLMVLQQVAVQVAIVDKLMETITIGDTTNITAITATATAALLAKQIPLPSKCADTPEVFRVCSYISVHIKCFHTFLKQISVAT